MTDADLIAFKDIARKSCGEPGRVLKLIAAFVAGEYVRNRRGEFIARRNMPDGAKLRRACSIIRTIEAETGLEITGRGRGPHERATRAREFAIRRLRDLDLSTPWIARLLDLESHATVVMALQRDAANAAEES